MPLHGRRSRGPRVRQGGVVLFVTMILLLILTVLGVSLARMQTVEERLAQNENNHQIALELAQATLQAAFDDDAGGMYPSADFAGGVTGLATLSQEIQTAPYTTLAYSADWSSPGTNTVVYNGAALASAPAAANPQFVIEEMAPAVPPGCNSGNAGNYQAPTVTIHRITAHSAGGDGSASATVQAIRIGSC